VLRFDRVERAVHWITAVLLLAALTTGLILYVGSLAALVGRRDLLRTIHVWSGLASPLPVLLAYFSPWRAALRADIRRLSRWTDADLAWFRRVGRRLGARIGKFNGGQKANAVYISGALAVMVMTGSVMRWAEHFPLSWRTGATFVHDWTAISLWIVIPGHILKAFAEPAALKAMYTGWMDARAARRDHPAWWDELEEQSATPASGDPDRR
jgi:formate dehydrogenase subunit gamma